jgi:HTH-type transcriptional regulator/antitoxin HigA
MPNVKNTIPNRLPTGFAELSDLVPARAIMAEREHTAALEMINRLTSIERLSPGQSVYFETLIQLVQAYEARNEPIDVDGLTGVDLLRFLLSENGLTAADLARILGIHASMGSKILRGDRSLTLDHVKKLAIRFRVRPDAFMD